VAFARLEDCEAFAARWGGWARQLSITAADALTVLGDGAAWIWNRAAEPFPQAAELLDIFHATEHVATAARVCFGEGTAASRVGTERVRRQLLGDGWPGLCDAVGELVTPGMAETGRAAVDDLVGYWAGQSSRLGYYARLQKGRSIGSGAVEGLAKRVGRRLKVAGRGWDPRHIDPLATLTIAAHSPEWDDLWRPSPN